MPALTAKDFGRQYYEEHKAAGLDYAVYGLWHQEYCAMVTEMTLQNTYHNPFVFDGGCACGSLLRGFKEVGAYKRVFGIEAAEYMVEIGRNQHGLTSEEIMVGTLMSIPLPANSVSLINTSQVLEHIPEKSIGYVIREFYRILQPGGRMFHNLASLKYGNPPHAHATDPTHVNIKPLTYWPALFEQHGFVFDIESFERFVCSSRSPWADNRANFFNTYLAGWTSCALLKPVSSQRWLQKAARAIARVSKTY